VNGLDILDGMKVVILDPPEELLAGRRRKGQDRFDEVWEGVLHMVPPPSFGHQAFGTELLTLLAPVAKAKGIVCTYETGVFRPGTGESDYRQPDLVFALPSQVAKRGIEGPCELVVEILSPGDETYEKLPFYASLGVREVLVASPDTRAVELYVLRGARYVQLSPDEKGVVRSQALGVAFATVSGPRLRVSWPDGAGEI
jgi:Uma2 family endonuclease